jgi:hypothetical protein
MPDLPHPSLREGLCPVSDFVTRLQARLSSQVRLVGHPRRRQSPKSSYARGDHRDSAGHCLDVDITKRLLADGRAAKDVSCTVLLRDVRGGAESIKLNIGRAMLVERPDICSNFVHTSAGMVRANHVPDSLYLLLLKDSHRLHQHAHAFDSDQPAKLKDDGNGIVLAGTRRQWVKEGLICAIVDGVGVFQVRLYMRRF